MPERMVLTWTIYDHPEDYPDHFVVRQWKISTGWMLPAAEPALFKTVDAARSYVRRQYPGALRIDRQVSDDPVILETWV